MDGMESWSGVGWVLGVVEGLQDLGWSVCVCRWGNTGANGCVMGRKHKP